MSMTCQALIGKEFYQRRRCEHPTIAVRNYAGMPIGVCGIHQKATLHGFSGTFMPRGLPPELLDAAGEIYEARRNRNLQLSEKHATEAAEDAWLACECRMLAAQYREQEGTK